MILECDGEAMAGWSLSPFLHNETRLVDERRAAPTRVLRQAGALATSVCVLRVYRIVEVFAGPRIQSINVTQHGGSMSHVTVLGL